MKVERLAATVGLSLLGLCFAYAAFTVLGRRSTEARDGETVVRIGHWQLEAGIRDALDGLARDYEALHPGVRIEQVAVPERTYAQWVKTQLIGGTAPDLIELGKGTEDDVIARHFLPVSTEVRQPNPYNAGTPLADTPWRETFLDGLSAGYAYRPNLLAHYGVPLTTFTTRLFYNRDLWRRLLGDTPPPEDYEGFIAACEKLRAAAAAHGIDLVPVAGSQLNGSILLSQLMRPQTQRLLRGIDRGATLKPANTDLALAVLRGEIRLDDPGFLGALALAREVSQQMQPGYLQAARDDAMFYFVQQRAAMIVTGSWDAPAFRALAPFEVGVLRVPLPGPDHPVHGAHTYGPPAEADTVGAMTFGVARASRHSGRAIDFLRFITSRQGNARFSELSGWLPSVREVEPAPALRPFVPLEEGYVNGFDLGFGNIGASTRRLLETSLNQLVRPTGSPDDFIERFAPALPGALREDLERVQRNALQNIARQDPMLVALLGRDWLGEADPTSAEKMRVLLEGQNEQEAQAAWIEHELTTQAR